MDQFLRDKTPFERLVIVGGAFWLGAKLLDALFTPHDTVNYKLYHKRRLVYHGIAYEDRLDARLDEHEICGKVFDDCVYDEAKPRLKAVTLERKRIKRDRPIYNRHHNS